MWAYYDEPELAKWYEPKEALPQEDVPILFCKFCFGQTLPYFGLYMHGRFHDLGGSHFNEDAVAYWRYAPKFPDAPRSEAPEGERWDAPTHKRKNV